MYDVAIVGCGVIGAAVAYLLSRYEGKIIVLEKENDVSLGATRANSAILHAGYDPEPGTKMARLNVRGVEMAKEICRDLNVAYQRIGSLVIALSDEEVQTVQMLYERGKANGVPGVRIVSKQELREMEPQISEEARCALYAPSAAIVNPWEYAIAMAETAARNGAEVRLNSEVTAISWEKDAYVLETASGTIRARYVVNAAGVNSAMVHEMVAAPAFRILPNKGEYYIMDKAECFRAKHVLFQCPSKDGKGVLVSPTVHGNLIVGPNAEASDEPERVNTTAAGLAFVRDKAAKTIPGINYRNAIRNFAGMRANSDQSDFFIEKAANHFIDLACIKSPGLSSAPAIAEEALALLEKDGYEKKKKTQWISKREKIPFNQLNEEGKKAAIAANPLYGRVICRCETVTEGEIVDAIHSPIPPRTVDGIKRRCGAGMGRCQGGFCGPRVVEILAREWNVDPMAILKDKNGSFILLEKTKGEKA